MGVQENWSTTAASNATADTSINWQENQAPSTINDSARSMMAALKKTVKDIAGPGVTSGTLTAYTLASNEGFTSLFDGLTVQVRAHTTSGANPTFNLDSLGAKSIKILVGVSPPIGTMLGGGVYTLTYYAADTTWLLSGGPVVGKLVGESFGWNSDTLPPLSLWCNGQAVSRTTYAALFAAIGTTFGTGDGSTTFNVPDDRGRAEAGKDNMGGVASANRLPAGITGGVDGSALGNVGGEASHTLTGAESGQKAISAAPVAITDPGHTHVMPHTATTNGSGSFVAKASGTNDTTQLTQSSTTGITAAFTLSASSASSAHNNAQPTIIRNRCIFAGA